MLVYREGHRPLDLPAIARDVAADTRAGDGVSALIGAGQLECALADLGDAAEARAAALVDALADALIAGRAPDPVPPLDVPARPARGSVPEGFAYYGVHPLDHAEAARRAVAPGAPALAIGVRSIGTTLSAVVAASLRARGSRCPRITVRPSGHPFSRSFVLDGPARAAVHDAAAQGAVALIVDEGPGISGSTFLAVADALVEAGLDRGAIVLLPSHDPDPSRLRARDGAARWTALRREVAVPTRVRPAGAGIDLSGGAWRDVLVPAGRERPIAWPATERRKHLAAAGDAVLKLEGLGRAGAIAIARGERLAALGISPAVTRIEDGFARHARARGIPMERGDAPPLAAIIRRIAALEETSAAGVAFGALEEMVRTNVHELLGIALDRVELPIERATIVDGRMQPPEWISDGERVLKVDAISHGDDHFFPGPCDAAWDVAGAIVEWGLDRGAEAALVARVAAATADPDLPRRMPAWTVAYAAFRAAWLVTARDASVGSPDHPRLAREAERVRAVLAARLPDADAYRKTGLASRRG